MALRRLCRFCGCTKYREDGHNFCSKHLWYEEKKIREREESRSAGMDFSKFSHRASENYRTARWRKERAQFLKENPQCVYCGDKATVVDHIIRHRGDDYLFWDKGNWQPLCQSCHTKKTISEVREK